MKKIVPNLLLLALLPVSLLFLSAPISQAKKCGQGCCAQHAGVCTYQCCDGTPLSDKCAPCYQYAIDAQIKKDINAIKAEYKKNPDGYREGLIRKIGSGYGRNVDINRVGFFVYTMLPDIK